jgi:hypothetical protein
VTARSTIFGKFAHDLELMNWAVLGFYGRAIQAEDFERENKQKDARHSNP